VGSPELLDRLRQHKSLGAAPGEELAWLVAHGTQRSFQAGEVTTGKLQPEEWLHIALTGHVAIHVDRGTGSRKIIEWRGGDVFGLMPYSRGGAPPGDTIVEEPTETLAIHRELLPAMIRECPGITARLVHAMLDRARHFTSSDLHDEKLFALGKFAAGLAHELNNPASAAARSSQLLVNGLAAAEQAARSLAGARLSNAQLAAIDVVRELCQRESTPLPRSPVEGADREDALASWLAAHRVDDAIAPSLAETVVTPVALESLAVALPSDALDAGLRWIAASRLVRALASEIETSASRIHELVAAVKGFTYMDHLPAPEAVDLRQGVMDTIAVLSGKARAKSVEIRADLAPDLPRVFASGAELNQVWANLIDNAIDAVSASGHVEVMAGRELNRVVVCIIDDGPGIAQEIQGRIFDPFFTTKEVGQGIGLGLDIVRRLVQRQAGEIQVESQAGHTVFAVTLATAGS
jgi:signal transduction histidine kinase